MTTFLPLRRKIRPNIRVVQGLAWLVLANLVIRLTWLWYMHPPQVDDFAWYFSHATQIWQGQGYVWYGHPTAYWPIGYPFFLSVLFHLTGPSVMAGLVTNVLLSTGIVLLVYALTIRLFHTPTVAFWAAAGYTCLPSQVEWNSVLGSEELFTFLLLFALWLYLPRIQSATTVTQNALGRIFLSGVVMGFAADVRPIVLLFPIVVLMYEWWVGATPQFVPYAGRVRAAFLTAFVFACGLLAGVSPVTLRNYIAIHHFILISTNGGVNLWQGTHTNGAYFWSWDPKVNPLLPYVKNDYLQNKVALHTAFQFYIHHPLKLVAGGLAKWFFLYWVDWNVVSVTFAEKSPHVAGLTLAFNMWFDTLVYYFWMFVSVLGLVRTVQTWQNRTKTFGPSETYTGGLVSSPAWWLVLGYLAYNTAIFFFFPAWDRFRYPMMPLYAVFFGVGARYLWKRVQRRSHHG